MQARNTFWPGFATPGPFLNSVRWQNFQKELGSFIESCLDLSKKVIDTDKPHLPPPSSPNGIPSGQTTVASSNNQGSSVFQKIFGKKSSSQKVEPLEPSQNALVVVDKPVLQPSYDYTALFEILRVANDVFLLKWLTLLGIQQSSDYQREHWTRVKALSRRYAESTAYYYDTLDPLGDMANCLMTAIRLFIETPTKWSLQNASKEAKQAEIEQISRSLSVNMNEQAIKRLTNSNQRRRWVVAYLRSGTGSTKVRAAELHTIYNTALPNVQAKFSDELTVELKKMIEKALNQIYA